MEIKKKGKEKKQRANAQGEGSLTHKLVGLTFGSFRVTKGIYTVLGNIY